MTPVHPSIEQLRATFVENGLDGRLWSWLQERLVDFALRRLRGRYRAQVYSPTREWDRDGCIELTNEFILKRGILKGAIARGLLTAPDTPRFVSFLETSFKNFVVSERPRSMSRNIFDRLREVLDKRPDFIRLGGVPPRLLYGLADWEDDPPQPATDDTLLQAERHLPKETEWVTYSSGTRQSPGISSDGLERIVYGLLSGLGRLLTAQQIMAVLSRRYPLQDDLAAASAMSLEGLGAPAAGSPLESAEANELATRALYALTPRQREIVQLMLDEPSAVSTRELAQKLKISKSTAATELQAIQNRFRLLGVTSEDMQRQVLDALWPLLKAS